MRTIYLNGSWLHESEAKLSVYDLSVMQAVAAFEMTRSFNGKTFKLDEHLARLEQSCNLLGIPLALSRAALHAVCDEIVDRNRDVFDPADEHRLLIVASPGCAPMYRELEGVIAEPYVYVTDFPLRFTVEGMSWQFFNGGTAKIVPTRQMPASCVPAITKHRSRLHFHLAQAEARCSEVDWAFMLDERGCLAECPGANIVLVKDGQLVTPDTNCLEGISLQTVLSMAVELGLSYRRDPNLKPADLWRAKEVFVTGTPFCLLPIVEVDGLPVNEGRIGPVYTQLLEKWSASVGLSIAAQVRGWDLERVPR